uniref:Small ribosomal subunit protein uS14c n=1 Tax=Chloroparvula japonica TaxID=1411623 RepID=A0A4D6C551_9CHLO|nr:ribosomal protein S14 [Chloroparvula japonica]QBX98149.1 ribosomal protein S14 [Chloroparvula japonica]
MARKSLIVKEKHRQASVNEYAEARFWLKQQIKRCSSYKMRVQLQTLLQEFPRDSARVRLHTRCSVTGRPKAVYRQFGLSRHLVRSLAHEGLLPGVHKASW